MGNTTCSSKIPVLSEYSTDIYSWVLLGPDGKTELDIGPANSNAIMDSTYAFAFLFGPAVRNIARRNVFNHENISICDCTLIKRRYRGPGYFLEVCGSKSLKDEFGLFQDQQMLEDEFRAEQERKKQAKAQK